MECHERRGTNYYKFEINYRKFGKVEKLTYNILFESLYVNFDYSRLKEANFEKITHLSLKMKSLSSVKLSIFSKMPKLEHLEINCQTFLHDQSINFEWTCKQLNNLCINLVAFNSHFLNLHTIFPLLESLIMYIEFSKENLDEIKEREEKLFENTAQLKFLKKFKIIHSGEIANYLDQNIQKTLENLKSFSCVNISSEIFTQLLSAGPFHRMKEFTVESLHYSEPINIENLLLNLPNLENLTIEIKADKKVENFHFKIPSLNHLVELTLKIPSELDTDNIFSPLPHLKRLNLSAESKLKVDYLLFPELYIVNYNQNISTREIKCSNFNLINCCDVEHLSRISSCSFSDWRCAFHSVEFLLFMKFVKENVNIDVDPAKLDENCYLSGIFFNDINLRKILFTRNFPALTNYIQLIFPQSIPKSWNNYFLTLSFNDSTMKYLARPNEFPFNWENYHFIQENFILKEVDFLVEVVSIYKALAFIFNDLIVTKNQTIDEFIFGRANLQTNNEQSTSDLLKEYCQKMMNLNSNLNADKFIKRYFYLKLSDGMKILDSFYWLFTNEESPFSSNASLGTIELFDDFFGIKTNEFLNEFFHGNLSPIKQSILQKITGADLEKMQSKFHEEYNILEFDFCPLADSLILLPENFANDSSIFKKLKLLFSSNFFDKCPICFELISTENSTVFTYRDQDILRTCHNFHVKCLSDWLKIKTNCPVCKRIYEKIQ